MSARSSLRPPPQTRSPEKPAPRPSPWRFLWNRARHEARSLLPAWIFFLLSLALIRLTQMAVLEEFGVNVVPDSKVLVGSLLVAKALLTVDNIRMFSRLEDRPVIVTALFKTFVYTIVVFFFEYCEVLFEFRKEGLAAGHADFVHRLGSLRTWVIQIWLVVLLFCFSAGRTLARRLGVRGFRHLLIGR